MPGYDSAGNFIITSSSGAAKGRIYLGENTTTAPYIDEANGGILHMTEEQAGITASANPMDAVGQLIAGGAGGALTKVAANATATRKFLREQGTGAAGQAPEFDTLAIGDIPTITSAKLDPTVLQHKQQVLTDTNLKAMYATPVEILAAVAGKMHVVESAKFSLNAGTQFTGGGNVALQYTATNHGAGTALHAVIANTVVQSGTDNHTVRQGADLSGLAEADAVNVPVTISNAGAAFADGDGTLTVDLWYRTVTI